MSDPLERLVIWPVAFSLREVLMKALSIRSDYVMDIFRGIKTVEYRSWSTKYRGDLLICGTAKKVPGGIPGYATCVAKLVGIDQYGAHDYGWRFAPFGPNGSYWIKPIPVKGQLGLFTVDDQLIVPAPIYGPKDATAARWFTKVIAPLVYWKVILNIKPLSKEGLNTWKNSQRWSFPSSY